MPPKYTTRSYIRNPAAYAAAVKRNKFSGSGAYYKAKPRVRATAKPRSRPVRSSPKPRMNFGQKVGAAAGNIAYNAIKKLTGFGDYKESGRPLNMGGSVPQFSNSGSVSQAGSIRVQHREYIQDIQGSVGFNIQSFILNPGLNDTFPWLNALAANFEQYRICGMAFCYKATCATAVASTNTALGTVIMATQYNANASPFQNKQQMENYQFAQSGVPFNDICHYIECAKSQTSVSNLYVRTGSVPPNQDARLYDMGVFYLATVGMQASSTVGELWCTYDIELLKPRIITGSGGNVVLTDKFTLGTTPTSTAWLGVGAELLPTDSSNIGGVITPSASTNLDTYTFPPEISSGTYMLVYRCLGVTTTLTNTIAITVGANLVPGPNLWSNGSSFMQPAAGVSTQSQYAIGIVRFVGSIPGQNFIRFTAGTLPASVVNADFMVTQINPTQLALVSDMSESKYSDSQIEKLVESYLAKKIKGYSLEAVAENVNNIDRTLGLPEVQPEPDPDPPLESKKQPKLKAGLSLEDDDGIAITPPPSKKALPRRAA